MVRPQIEKIYKVEGPEGVHCGDEVAVKQARILRTTSIIIFKSPTNSELSSSHNPHSRLSTEATEEVKWSTYRCRD